MAKRVTFVRDFDHRPTGVRAVIVAYKRGMRRLVPEDCARQAAAAAAIVDVAPALKPQGA